MATKEEMRIDDPANILHFYGAFQQRQENLIRRILLPKFTPRYELVRMLEINCLAESDVSGEEIRRILSTKGSARGETDSELLHDFLSLTQTFKSMETEYDVKATYQFGKFLNLSVHNPGEDVLAYSIFFFTET